MYIRIKQSQMISNYAKLWVTFCKRQWRLQLLVTSLYVQLFTKWSGKQRYEKIRKIFECSENKWNCNYCTNFSSVRIDKADAENTIETLNSSKVGIFKTIKQNALKLLLIFAEACRCNTSVERRINKCETL